tara:strand:- start:12746 stop:13969 length:1224 start_codon:yes stop_codon:yes gene_type:complete
MADCIKKVIDVFATHTDEPVATTPFVAHNKDDVWQGPVWSVELAETDGALTYHPTNSDITALVCNWETDWIMTAAPGWNVWELEVGDTIRIGNVGSNGYSEYLTVLEKIKVNKVANGSTDADISWFKPKEASDGTDSNDVLEKQSTDADGEWDDADGPGAGSTNTSGKVKYVQLTQTYYAYRINMKLDATTPALDKKLRGFTGNTLATKTLPKRHVTFINHSWAHNGNENWPDNDVTVVYAYGSDPAAKVDSEIYYKQWQYPLFKRVNPHKRSLQVKLDRGIKAIHWIKLYAATFANKNNVGYHTSHEVAKDDWIALHIDEVPGDVISNHSVANGAFAVLHAGFEQHGTAHGSLEVHEQEIQGLVTHIFEQPKTDTRSLTIHVRNRFNEAADMGRIHLWFKLCVSHG